MPHDKNDAYLYCRHKHHRLHICADSLHQRKMEWPMSQIFLGIAILILVVQNRVQGQLLAKLRMDILEIEFRLMNLELGDDDADL